MFSPSRCDITVLTMPLVYVNNHTEVWGSWYDMVTGSWGYACCRSSIHMSYCTGEAGIKASEESSAKHLLQAAATSSMPPPPPPPAADNVDDRKKKAEELFSKKRLGEGDLALDKSKLAQAITDERKRKAKGGEDDDRFGKKQKSYEVSEEELGKFIYAMLCERFAHSDIRRGVPNESPNDGGSDGELCGHGALRWTFVLLPTLLYATPLVFLLFRRMSSLCLWS